ncbi:SLBB domain-containing protein, partial [Candidatus Saganbacteria bacterium]|nr:SLBB domain-containing protein [Candidatus Saganbacteria bacterium]
MFKKFKKIVCLLLITSFSASALLAQTGPQANQVEAYLKTPQAQDFLRSDEGQKLLSEYAGKAGQDTARKNKAGEADKTLGTPEALTKMAEKPLSELELVLSADLLLESKKPLRQYGYDVFDATVSTFVPADDSPVGPDYIIGPGDSLNITLWGIAEGIFRVDVNREGTITLPKVGVLGVAGLSFGELKPFIEQRLSKFYESVNVGVTINNLRSIRVFIVGDVNAPGSYNVSSLTTAFNALFTAGGPGKKGSMRNIQVIRNGMTVARLDLYRFLLKGDKSQDFPLQSGDTVFVPVIGPVAGIAGAVYRPGIYELKGKTDLSELLYLAGGVLPTSYLSRIQVKRVLAHDKRVVRDENVSPQRASEKFNFSVQNMDLVEIFPIFEGVSNQVFLEGAAKYPGTYEYKRGMRVKDLLPNAGAFALNAYLPHLEIVRSNPETREMKIFSMDFNKLFVENNETENYALQPFDRIIVSSEKMKKFKVILSGEVKRPGAYSILPGERLSSVLKRAGGYTSDAYLYGAKFIRLSVKEIQGARSQELIAQLQANIIRYAGEASTNVLGENEKAAAQAQLERAQKLLDLLKERLPEGRVIVTLLPDLDIFSRSHENITLEDGDALFIPSVSNVVSVLGEVFTPSSVIYNANETARYFL